MIREIHHSALHDKVYRELRRNLMSGQFEAGQTLSSRKLAAALGTSDMPVRTALVRLLAEGGLVRRNNKTICVPTCSRRSFTETMDLRIVLEGYATRRACGQLSERDFNTLNAHAAALEEAIRTQDLAKYLDNNRMLKFSIYRRCGSDVLLSTLANLWLKVGPFLRSLSLSLANIAAANFHEEAIAALRRGEADAAAEAIVKDVSAGRDLLLATATFEDEDNQELRRSTVGL